MAGSSTLELVLQIFFGFLGVAIALIGLHYRESILWTCVAKRYRNAPRPRDLEGMLFDSKDLSYGCISLMAVKPSTLTRPSQH